MAKLVVGELVRLGYVRDVETDCALGSPGYPPAVTLARHLRAQDDQLFTLNTNGLEVGTNRCVHISPDLQRVKCPACATWFDDVDTTGWQAAVGDWYDGGEGALKCPQCTAINPVANWTHDPACGFGYLAFTFWNWPQFTDAVWRQSPAQVIETILGRKCTVVYGKL